MANGKLRYIYACDAHHYPQLFETMFKDRAWQFKHRLNWDVTVDAYGFETDEYDDINPLYVIWENSDGSHGASARYLPFTGRTMIKEKFPELLPNGSHIHSPHVWEITRYCMSPKADASMRYALELGSGELFRKVESIKLFAGVVDKFSLRKYQKQKSPINHVGRSDDGELHLITYRYHEDMFQRALSFLEISENTSTRWINESAGIA